MKDATTVFVVDDDPTVVQAVSRLLRSENYQVREFSSPEAFLAQHSHEVPGCAILDLAMPGMSGLDLQRALSEGGLRHIIFVSAFGDVPSSVDAMKAGAVDFLVKPFDDVDLLRAVNAAIEKDLDLRAERAERESLQKLLVNLTPREHEVLMHVVAGRINKRIAADLGISEKTVKVHRARVMEKMNVESVAELARLCERSGIGAAPSRP
jgi:RNA polymerase sigma factor (sigma-70 family)